MEHEYEFTGNGYTTVDDIVENVVLTWPGACLAGRVEAANEILDDWNSSVEGDNGVFDYIYQYHSKWIGLFVERCGWTAIEREKEWPVVGKYYWKYGRPVLCVGFWDHEEGDGYLPESISPDTSHGYAGQVVHVVDRNGSVNYYACDPYDHSDWVQCLPPVPFKWDDFVRVEGWHNAKYHLCRWDSAALMAHDIPASDARKHPDGDVVALTLRADHEGDDYATCKAWGDTRYYMTMAHLNSNSERVF